MSAPTALDARTLEISFQVRWFGIIAVRGTFTRVKGEITSGAPCPGVRVAAEAASMTTGIALRDRHLRGPRFLHADLHPFIRFQSRLVRIEAGQLVMEGLLELCGRTTQVRASCPVDEWQRAGDSMRVCAHFTFSRTEHAVGMPDGMRRFNPMFLAIADDVHVHVRAVLPSADVERLGAVVQGARPRAATGHDDST